MLALAGTALVACSSAVAAAPDWQPKQDAPYAAEPQAPGAQPSRPGVPGSPNGPGATPSTGPSGTAGPDPNVLATGLTDPVGLVLLPDGTALVGERTTGRILQVQPQPQQPTPVVQTLTGLDPGGDGGLLDLTVSPTYAEDGLVYAYVTTATDNEVVTFTLGGPVTAVVKGIPKGATGNAGRITFDSGGDLLVATGTAGLPATPTSLAGKVLRYDDIGRPAPDDPTAGSPVLTTALTGAEALCLVPGVPTAPTGSTVLVGAAANGQVAQADAGRPLEGPVVTLPGGTGLGGCAVQGSRLYLTSADDRTLYGADLGAPSGSVRVGTPTPTLRDTYGRLRTVVAAPDGTLWLTTSNKDGRGSPVAADDRVVRITPSGGGGGGSKA